MLRNDHLAAGCKSAGVPQRGADAQVLRGVCRQDGCARWGARRAGVRRCLARFWHSPVQSVCTYFVKFSVGDQQRRLTLGRVVRGNLKQMRLMASEILAKARLGKDTVAERRAAAAKNTIPTLGELVPLYLTRAKRARTSDSS